MINSQHNFKVLLGIAGFMIWVLLLILGITINSYQFSHAIEQGHYTFTNFLMVGLTYTPINVALMSVVAGMIGGITSNFAAENIYNHLVQSNNKRLSDFSSPEYQQLMYMREHPLVSALRGFVVYLIFVVSTYISVTSETKQTIFDMAQPGTIVAPALYYKFALTVSLIAFVVGYDPTRLNVLINSVPFFGDKKS